MRASARLGVAGGERCSGGWQPALATKPCDQAELAPRGHAADATNWLEFLGSNGVHPKLTVSNPGDREEREADAIADRVMRMTTPAGGPLPMRSVSGSSAGLSRACCASCADCEKEQEDDRPVSRKARGPGVAEGAAQAAAEAVSHDGEPLGGPERSFFEPRFGRDLSGVRIHTNSGAALAASGIDAYAYASGRHIAFAAGQYRPRTNDGLRLLAHELAHVVQQQGLEQPRLSRQVIGGGSISNSTHASRSPIRWVRFAGSRRPRRVRRCRPSPAALWSARRSTAASLQRQQPPVRPSGAQRHPPGSPVSAAKAASTMPRIAVRRTGSLGWRTAAAPRARS